MDRGNQLYVLILLALLFVQACELKYAIEANGKKLEKLIRVME